MVTYGKLDTYVDIPEEVQSVKVDNSKVTIKGKLGELTKDFKHTDIKISKVDNQLYLEAYFPRRRDKAMIYTVRAHLNNMFNGVTKGYEYRMKVVFSHFPIRVIPDLKNREVKIENLYGGRKPRFAKIVGDVKVDKDGDDVIVEGIDKEAVGQTCANIQELTRQRGKRRQSPKTFMDGVFIYDKKVKE
ncbi:MAG: 50S ribosomal protein L6 [Candidatus Heimdallarchaeota archaeon]|nr:50S ribosomal protein L6 [Candidatus Heimdallarchaeota archaeon]